MTQYICCWNTECEFNERYKNPHPDFVGYCKKSHITIGCKGTMNIECYSSTIKGILCLK